MREIKFRAWNTERKKMVSWDNLLGNLSSKTTTEWNQSRYSRQDFILAIDAFNKKETCLLLMQYTGLKDKNGKEIYEGDIVRQEIPQSPTKNKEYSIGKIEFVCGMYAIVGKIYMCAKSDLVNARFIPSGSEWWENDKIFIPRRMIGSGFCGHDEEWEIIGNIYENQDLLKVKKIK